MLQGLPGAALVFTNALEGVRSRCGTLREAECPECSSTCHIEVVLTAQGWQRFYIALLQTATSTMSGAWLSLPARWKLQDVQAVTNVIITALSTLGIFTFIRIWWQ